jgi:hypothetical protein
MHAWRQAYVFVSFPMSEYLKAKNLNLNPCLCLPVSVAHFKCSDGEVAVTGVGFSADGAAFVTAVGDGTAALWSTTTWAKITQVGFGFGLAHVLGNVTLLSMGFCDRRAAWSKWCSGGSRGLGWSGARLRALAAPAGHTHMGRIHDNP